MSEPVVYDAAPPIEYAAFIRANTRLQAPPLVPEIKLYLADETLAIWQKTEDELGLINMPPPFWAFAWAGGQALARYLLDNPELTSGKRVIDLGAGCGLPAIAAAKCGAARVLAADIDAVACAAAALNAQENGVVIDTTSADLLAAPPPVSDLVLIADLFYQRELADAAGRFLDAACAAGAVALVGDPSRNYFPADAYRQIASFAVPVPPELEDSTVKPTAVWQPI